MVAHDRGKQKTGRQNLDTFMLAPLAAKTLVDDIHASVAAGRFHYVY